MFNGLKGNIQGPRKVNELKRILNSNNDVCIEETDNIASQNISIDKENIYNKIICNIESIADTLQIDGKDRKAYIKVRVNQGIFRERLLRKYNRCCLCKVSNPNFLIASHIKPWSNCDANEKLDSDNGFLLCPNHDALFDLGYISFDDEGNILISDQLEEIDIVYMNIDKNMKINLSGKNKKYLEYHRKIFLV